MAKGKTALLAALAAFIAISSGCSGADERDPAADGVIEVTTTIGMITDIVKEVGGERVRVTGLMPAGVDPHLYKATQGDIRRLEQAEIIFYNGLHLEGKMAEVLQEMGKKKPAIPVAENIPKERLIAAAPNSGTEYDPHVWFDVELWMIAVEAVRDGLAAIDPGYGDFYARNAEDYLAKLAELHRYVQEQINSIPERSRVLVTAHDAFGYFGRAYGIEVRGLQGISTASEAGTKDVTDLRDFLVERKIKAIFVESSVPQDYMQAVVEGAREKGHEIVIGGELFSDAMGEEGTPEGTYIGMVRHNVDTIVGALK